LRNRSDLSGGYADYQQRMVWMALALVEFFTECHGWSYPWLVIHRCHCRQTNRDSALQGAFAVLQVRSAPFHCGGDLVVSDIGGAAKEGLRPVAAKNLRPFPNGAHLRSFVGTVLPT
jgi:hypothetical protein